MTTITIELPEGYRFNTRISGRDVAYTPQTMDQSYLLRFLEKGMQRYANDMYSGQEGNTKYDLCMALAAEANEGKKLEPRQRVAKLPSDVALAVKMAKQDLTIIFKQVTGKGKIADMVDNDKVAPFFKVTAESVVWNDETVQKWIAKQKEAGKRDYMAEAKASLNVDAAALDLEL